MSSIRARCGETVLELNGNLLTASIRQEAFGPYSIDASQRQTAWRSLQGLSVPLSLGGGASGVGGSGHEIEVRIGMTRVHAGWWMSAPPGWEPLEKVFEALAALAPREVTARYDFGQGGE